LFPVIGLLGVSFSDYAFEQEFLELAIERAMLLRVIFKYEQQKIPCGLSTGKKKLGYPTLIGLTDRKSLI
jgi:hypothetical protein